MLNIINFYIIKINCHTAQSTRTTSIPELGESSRNANTAVIEDELDDDEHLNVEESWNSYSFCEQYIFMNSSIVAWSYRDHEKKCEMVIVAVPIIAGARDISFEIADDGLNITINYLWPESIYNAKSLFHDEIADLSISTNHPKIHSLTSALLKAGITSNSNPRGKIRISLPTKIQREVGSWAKKAKTKLDGSKIVVLEFTGFQEKLIIKEADTRIIFLM